MLHLIPPPLHRAALRLAHGLRKRLWRWRPRVLNGASMIARDGYGRVLLVRHSYGSDSWTLPGGGIRADEKPAIAALREFEEELGCGVSDLTFLGVREEQLHGSLNRVHVFTGVAQGVPRADGRELTQACFFARDDLPEAISPLVAQRLALLDR
ncbi:NUDIX hydrolase [Altericroceibacterium endophyticum]|uniref:NUDIX domain-containing protein n=1 Tax=Altericroceibacterium endophyticum TaxID=1808508 RepID=A0A6I4T9N8_9SPHN|nr:NUDIX domain-containing protein [Altericroceibacterium endophyticum]MXO67002.1 NUDIX domain-containing protein [Altericroceibacterium endophyticum]